MKDPRSVAEMDGDIVNHWYILAHESEVPADKPIRRMFYDKPYVVFRDGAGVPRAYLDQCIHRGAPLSEGWCDKGGIRCPYHGWRFHADGQVAEVPSTGEECGGVEGKWRLKGPATVFQDGCLWVWGGAGDPATATPPWRFPMPHGKHARGYFMVTDFDNEVGHLVQNFMDVPHTVYVHDKWFRKRRAIKVTAHVAVSEGRVKVTYHQPDDSIGFMGRILNPSKAPMIHTDVYIFPNLTRVDYTFGSNGFIINSQCTPVTRHRTRVYTWIAYNVGFLSRFLEPFFRFYTRKVITQDVVIMEQHGGVVKLLGESTPHSTAADELHLAVQKLRDAGAQDRQKPYVPNYERERDFWI